MQRRNVLIGLGGLAGVGGAVGSGAFTSVSANRTVDVSVAGDASALLAMEPATGPNAQFASIDSSTGNIRVDLSDDGGQTGLGTDSVYEFDRVFRATNQGTQPVYLWANFSGGDLGDGDIWFYPESDSTKRLQDGDESVVALDVGETVTFGIHVNTDSLSSSDDQSLTATLTASTDRPDESAVTDSDGDLATAVVSENPTGDQFGSIQDAIDAVESSTVLVEPGTYAEDLTISTEGLTLRGLDGGDVVIHPGTASEGEYLVTVKADNVTIENLVLDGNNPDLSSGTTVGGEDVNAGGAVSNYDGTGLDISGLVVRDCVIRTFNYYGILAYPSAGGTSTGNRIENNEFRNLGGTYEGEYNGETVEYNRIGVLMYNNFYADIVDNTMRDVGIGVQTGNYYEAGERTEFRGNDIQSSVLGIWHNLAYQNASTFDIVDNTLSSVAGDAASSDNIGVYLTSLDSSVDAVVRDNVVSDSAVGYQAWNIPTDSVITVEGGRSVDNAVGVLAGESLYNDSAGDDFDLVVDSLDVVGSTDVDIRAQEDQFGSDTDDPEVRVFYTGMSGVSTDALEGAVVEEAPTVDAAGGGDFADLQTAVSQVDAPALFVRDGTYDLGTDRLNIRSSDVTGGGLSIVGESEDGVVVDASARNSWGAYITQDNVTLANLTVKGPENTGSDYPGGYYGLKVYDLSNFTLRDATVEGSAITQVDVNSSDGVSLRNVTFDGLDSNYGTGLFVVNSRNVAIESITARNNPWGGIGISAQDNSGYQVSNPTARDISLSGSNTIEDSPIVYTEEQPDSDYHTGTARGTQVDTDSDGAWDVQFPIAGDAGNHDLTEASVDTSSASGSLSHTVVYKRYRNGSADQVAELYFLDAATRNDTVSQLQNASGEFTYDVLATDSLN